MGYRVEKMSHDGRTMTVHRLGDSAHAAIRKADMCNRDAPQDTFRVPDPAGRAVCMVGRSRYAQL